MEIETFHFLTIQRGGGDGLIFLLILFVKKDRYPLKKNPSLPGNSNFFLNRCLENYVKILFVSFWTIPLEV